MLLTRRHFLAGAAATSTLGALPARATTTTRPLVLIELAGGNDALNTVAPIGDRLYPTLRPSLALDARDALAIGDGLALHPSLGPLKPLLDRGELAAVLGVGKTDGNRSHFSSIDTWETATPSLRASDRGWLDRVLDDDAHRLADGLVFNRDDAGPLRGRSGVFTAMKKKPLQRIVDRIPTEPARGRFSPALTHVLKTERDLVRISDGLADLESRAPDVGDLGPGPLARQLAQTARLILAGAHIPVFKLKLGGFDTHAGQPGPHARLLDLLATPLSRFRDILARHGRWRDTLVVTYAEFGRRAKENQSRGTDHGKASVHFALGGRVKGGLYGRYGSLDDLDDGDLVCRVDFRSVYTEIARAHLGRPASVVTRALGAHATLGFLKA